VYNKERLSRDEMSKKNIVGFFYPLYFKWRGFFDEMRGEEKDERFIGENYRRN
jgi:hypothetical protein